MTELSLHILDIVQNSIKALSSLIKININEDTKNNQLSIVIEDNGCGMDEEFLKDVVNPFRTTRTTRKVGLGLSLLKNACELTGGHLEITSKINEGTCVKAYFVYDSIDRQPIGDMASTMSAIIGGNDKIDYIYTHSFNGKEFTLSTKEMREMLGPEIELSNNDVLSWIEGYVTEQIEILYGGAI